MHAESAGADSMAGMDHGKMAMPQAPGMTMGKAIEGEPRALMRIDVKASPRYAKKMPATLSKLPAAKAPQGAPRRIKLAHDGKGQLDY
jgi:blue copper oxidase